MSTSLAADAPAVAPRISAPATRVLYVLKRFPQLSQTFVVREIAELEGLGVHVGVDALGPVADGPQQPDAAAIAAEVRHLPRRPRLRDRPALGVHARLALRHPLTWARLARRARAGEWRRFVQAGLVADRVRRGGFHHLHAHFASAASEVARDAAALAGCTYSVTAHAKDIFHDKHAAHLRSRVGAATAVVTVSDHNRRHLSEALPGLPVVHVPNGVPTAPAAARVPRGPVLCVARLVEKKGVDLLLRAATGVRDRCPGLAVQIIGTGEDEPMLRALATELGVDDIVTFLGAQPFEVVDAAMARCSMVVLPCRVAGDGDRDGLPTVIVEALARSRPVISTRVVGIPEVVLDGETGLLVDADDVGGLCDAIERLWHDPSLAAAMAEKGRRLVAEHFDPGRSAILLRRVFEQAGGR